MVHYGAQVGLLIHSVEAGKTVLMPFEAQGAEYYGLQARKGAAAGPAGK